MDIKDITIEDLKEQRPDLYQMIVEECGTQPLFVKEDDIQAILDPLFSEFERRANNKITALERELHKEVKEKLSDGLDHLSDIVEKILNKSKPYRIRVKADNKANPAVKKRNAVIGEFIRWRPTGESGKVVRYTYSGNVRKLVIKLKQGEYTEVYDNKLLYDIILEK